MTQSLTLSRDQVRAVDRRAIESLAMPGLMLMENAAINATAIIRDQLVRHQHQPIQSATVVIVCGGGNNAGDGYAIGRHLHNRGAAVHLFAAKPIDQLKGDAAINAAICEKMQLPITRVDEVSHIESAAAQWLQADGLIDAMLGTGFSGEVREPLASIIDRINLTQGPRVIAIDTPSGLDCQTGQPAASTIKAHQTITFVANKTGFHEPDAAAYTGAVRVADIGVPPELIRDVRQGR